MAPTYAVVDGSNIATEGRSVPSLAQLDAAVRQFQAEFPGTEVIVVVDATFGHRIDPAERKAFDDAVAHAELVSPPAGAVGRGDAFLLRVAERVDAQVLSNDSFQEFHAEHPWLFDEGRLIGGKPVPGVGWIFTPRSPVRGVRSRAAMAAGSGKAGKASPTSKATKATTRGRGTDGPRIGDSRPARDQLLIGAAVAAAAADVTGESPGPTGVTKAQKAPKTQKASKAQKAGKAGKAAKIDKAGKADKSAKPEKSVKAAKSEKTKKAEKTAQAAKSLPTEKAAKKTKKAAESAPEKAHAGKAKKTAKAPAARGRRATAPDVRAAIVAATVEAVDPGADADVPQPSRRRRGGSPAAVNDPLTFLTFVSEHPIGSTVEGTVSSFVSHGAMVDVGGMQCYVPLTGFASPPPRRAREVVDRGEQRQFVLVALDPARRGAELALPEIAPQRLAR